MEQSFFMQRLCKGNLEGDFFSGHFERYVNRALEMEHLSLCRVSIRGTWRGGFFSGDFERHVKRTLEMEHLSPCRSSVGEPGGELLSWELQKICSGAGEEASAHVFV
jgi:hypothetical protein